MYRKLFLNSTTANISPDHGDLTYFFNQPILFNDDEILEMKLSEAWFLLGGASNFVAYVVIDQLTDNYDLINNTTLGNQCTILAKIQNLVQVHLIMLYITILQIIEQEYKLIV